MGINEFYEIGETLRNPIAELVGIHPNSILKNTFLPDTDTIRKKELEGLNNMSEEGGGEEGN